MSLTAEQIEKSREEFETWFDKLVSDIEAGSAEDVKSTVRFFKEIYFASWLARQETLCVELPIAGNSDSAQEYQADVIERLNSAGIAHK